MASLYPFSNHIITIRVIRVKQFDANDAKKCCESFYFTLKGSANHVPDPLDAAAAPEAPRHP